MNLTIQQIGFLLKHKFLAIGSVSVGKAIYQSKNNIMTTEQILQSLTPSQKIEMDKDIKEIEDKINGHDNFR